MMKLTIAEKALIMAAIRANFGVPTMPINRQNIMGVCRETCISCVGKCRQINFDMRKTEDCLNTYILSQIYLQDRFGIAGNEVLTLNDQYPEKRVFRVQNWIIKPSELEVISAILESIPIEPGLIVKHYPDGVKTYQILPLELLEQEHESGYESGTIERTRRGEFVPL